MSKTIHDEPNVLPKETVSMIQDLVKAAQKILSILPDRSRAMVGARFGISQKRPHTLEEIGQKYHVTRERVRQIIRESLRKLNAHKDNPYLDEIRQQVVLAVRGNDGIITQEALLEKMAGARPQSRGALRLFLECIHEVRLVDEYETMEPSYAAVDFDAELWMREMEKARAVLEAKQDATLVEKILENMDAPETASPQALAHYLEVSRLIKKNSFGKWGLVEWPEICPKGAREKAFAILKEKKTPLHFREIARLIDEYYPGRKKTHPQTVHNELIKDEEFVLVGRGIYALGIWGYKRGTVKDVLEEMIRTHSGSMKREEILEAIMKIRRVKKSTVMINLNNFFAKTGRDTYTIKK